MAAAIRSWFATMIGEIPGLALASHPMTSARGTG